MNEISSLSDYNPKSQDGKVIMPAMLSVFSSLQDKMEKIFQDIRDEFIRMCSERDRKIEKMDGEIVSLKKKVEVLESKIDDNDAYERRDTAVVSGKALPAARKDENCSTIVRDLVKEKLNIEISLSDISVAHRLGEKKQSQAPDHRDIIVKFLRRDLKKDLVMASRRVKAVNFFINDSLTPLRQTIAYVLRKAKRKFSNIISGTSILDGKNYVWIHPPSPTAPNAKASRILVSTHDRLADFCTTYLNTPLCHFVEKWTH